MRTICTISIQNFTVFCAEKTWKKQFALSKNFGGKPVSIDYNHSGEKITTAISGGVGMWDSKTEEKLAFLILSNPGSLPGYNKPTMAKFSTQEDKLFIISRKGSRCCWELNETRKIWEEGPIDNMLGRATFNNDQTKYIMQYWGKAVVISALTGKIETTLWEKAQGDDNYSPVAGFKKNSSDIRVLYSKELENMSNDGSIQYHRIVPEGNVCSLYIPEKDTLVCLCNKDESVIMIEGDYFNAISPQSVAKNKYVSDSSDAREIAIDDALQVKIINCRTAQDENSFYIRKRRKAAMIQSSVHDNGKKLLVMSSREVPIEDFNDHKCFVDIFDLKNISEESICTIGCAEHPADSLLVPAQNLLLLAVDNQVQLWNITTESLLWWNKGESLNSISMSPDCKQIAMVNNGHVEIWKEAVRKD